MANHATTPATPEFFTVAVRVDQLWRRPWPGTEEAVLDLGDGAGRTAYLVFDVAHATRYPAGDRTLFDIELRKGSRRFVRRYPGVRVFDIVCRHPKPGRAFRPIDGALRQVTEVCDDCGYSQTYQEWYD